MEYIKNITVDKDYKFWRLKFPHPVSKVLFDYIYIQKEPNNNNIVITMANLWKTGKEWGAIKAIDIKLKKEELLHLINVLKEVYNTVYNNEKKKII